MSTFVSGFFLKVPFPHVIKTALGSKSSQRLLLRKVSIFLYVSSPLVVIIFLKLHHRLVIL